MQNRINPVLPLAVLALLVSGCASSTQPGAGPVAASKTAPVVIVKERSYANCPKFTQDKTFSVFSTAQLWAEHRRSAVLTPNDLTQWNPDFSRSTILMLSLGQSQTMGQRVHSGTGIERVGDELQVPVVVTRPGTNAHAGSALTNPCMYLQVMGANYKVISAFDQNTRQVMFKSAL